MGNVKNSKRVLECDENKNDKKDKSITIAHMGKRRYSSKVEYYESIKNLTDNSSPVKKYKKKHILRASSVKPPPQNLLVMKWDPPIKLSFD